MAEFRIGEVAKQTGMAASAIRYYESQGLIPKPDRRGGWRVYDESIMDQLGLIQVAKRAGFTMAEIKKLFAGMARSTPPGTRWRGLMASKMEEIDERIAEAKRMKKVLRVIMGCRCPTVADCGQALRSGKRRLA